MAPNSAQDAWALAFHHHSFRPKGGTVVVAGDGQVTLGETVMKANARKVRRLGKGDVIAGFAGATADAFALFERLEAKLEQHPGNLARACVELAKDWRTDRYLRRLKAMMAVADGTTSLILPAPATWSNRKTALRDRLRRALCARGRARAPAARFAAEEIARRAIKIAADICIYTNDNRRHRKHLHELLLTPREIVSELDRYIVGQADAKRAVAIALRNRWRRQHLTPELREEVLPKNILMIGPTGVGKTEISRRLASSAQAPFLKVEATKFTEVGYVGRDVEQIVRDLLEIAIAQMRERKAAAMSAPRPKRVPKSACSMRWPAQPKPRRATIPQTLRAGDLDDKEIELEMSEAGGAPHVRNPRHAGRADRHGQSRRHVRQGVRRARQARGELKVADARDPLHRGRSRQAARQGVIIRDAIEEIEQNGIVFLDEIDKICARSEYRGGGDVSREGVQRDLLPLIEGTTVSTKHGGVKTDHILFIASGAFHQAKPSDLLPELQGRLPIRVELKALDARRFPAHPHRTRSQPDQAIWGADGDGRRDARFHRRRHRRDRRHRRPGECHGREYRRAADCRPIMERVLEKSATPPPSAPAKRSPSTGLCARPGGRTGQGPGFVALHTLSKVATLQNRICS